MNLMHFRLIITLKILLSAFAWTSIAEAQTFGTHSGRNALIIGIGQYAKAPLTNPPNDALDLSKVLKDSGYDVDVQINLELHAFRAAITEFATSLTSEYAALFFFAGHAVQHNGENYLLPSGAVEKIKNSDNLVAETISLSEIFSLLNNRDDAVNIILLDACRTSPFLGMETDFAFGRGLAPVANSPTLGRIDRARLTGNLIGYATSSNSVARDGTGRNSPYTTGLLQAFKKPNITINAILQEAANITSSLTNGEQVPWLESSLGQDFYPAGQGNIELAALFNRLFDETAGEWAWGASDHFPIQWKFGGIKPLPGNVPANRGLEKWGAYYREGELVITNRGIPTHRMLDKSHDPVKWTIWLIGSVGSAGGVRTIKLVNDVVSHDLMEKPAVPIGMPRDGCRGIAGQHIAYYRVKKDQYSYAWIVEEYDCGGNRGCTLNYTIVYSDAKPSSPDWACR